MAVDVPQKLINQNHQGKTSSRRLLPAIVHSLQCSHDMRPESIVDFDVRVIAFLEPEGETAHNIQFPFRVSQEHEFDQFVLNGFSQF